MLTALSVRNVQEAYVRGLELVRTEGAPEDTRNGPALVVPWPVVTTYLQPTERVLLDPRRDANPFFHLMEAMWMLAGRGDVASLDPYLGALKKYSDDGIGYHGAYGFRWREHFGFDQLARVVGLLRDNPSDRRIVLSMWDPSADLGQEGADFPCNTHIYLRAVEDGEAGAAPALDMTVMCRSNDAIWGAYGANAVHFSVLLEFLAAASGLNVGVMHQWSNNLHAYLPVLDQVGEPMGGPLTDYGGTGLRPTQLFRPSRETPIREILRQVDAFWDGSDSVGSPDDRRDFFSSDGIATLIMVRAAHRAFRGRDRDGARSCASDIPGDDWRRACTEWLERRYDPARKRDSAED